MAKKTMIQAINEAMHQKMEEDQTVVVLGEDVGVDGGVFRATLGLIEKFGGLIGGKAQIILAYLNNVTLCSEPR